MLGNEGGRTAAVQMTGNHAAEADHDIGHTGPGKTGGIGSLTTVVNKQNHGAIRLNTNSRSGVALALVVAAGAGNILAVANANFPNANCFFDAVKGLIGFANLGRAVFHDCKIRSAVGGVAIAMLVIGNAIHYQSAAGGAALHIKDIAVDTGYNIDAAILLGRCRLIANSLQTVSIAVLIPVAGNQGRRAAQFNGDGKTGILIRAISIVNQKLGFLNARRYLIVRFGNQICVAGKSGCIQIHSCQYR